MPVTATLTSHGIDKLDDYFTKFIPALIGAMVLPALLGIYILSLDWISAVVLLLTIPLVPVFMALIGLHTQDTLAASQSKLDALAHQMYELAQGLPALLGLGRALGETMAVALVLSTGNLIPSLIKTGNQTIAAEIALNFPEAFGLRLAELIAAGLVLFLITLVVNMIARAIIARHKEFSGAN